MNSKGGTKKRLIKTDYLESKHVHALDNTTQRNSLEEVRRLATRRSTFREGLSVPRLSGRERC